MEVSEFLLSCTYVYSQAGVVAVTNSLFGPSTLPILYSDITCTGSETNLLECGRKLHGTFECPTDSIAGVICSDGRSYYIDHYLVVHCIVSSLH